MSVKSFNFWNYGAWAIATALEFALGSPGCWYVLTAQLMLVVGLLIGHFVVERS